MTFLTLLSPIGLGIVAHTFNLSIQQADLFEYEASLTYKESNRPFSAT